jgi:glycerol-3-phosphate dehydrogenase
MPSLRAALSDLATRELDLLVIGGGITGAGILRDAAMRGLSVGLVEQGDFAAGTSSRSSRLIHGGLRYLEHYQWRLVFEALRERAVLLRIAPHLVRPITFVVPAYRGDRIPRWKLAAGLGVYGLLAIGGNVARPRMFGKAGLLILEPGLRVRGLRGGGLYHDAQCDDARLVIATLRSGLAHGGRATNYARVTGLVSEGGKVVGVEAHDLLTGDRATIRARAVINATGPWVDTLRRMEDPGVPALLRLSSGAHVVVPRDRLGHTNAITFTSSVDGRVMFILPWGSLSYIGTTETDFTRSPEQVTASQEEVRYLLRSANALFPQAHLGEEDVLATWAGVRPLLAGHPNVPAGAVSREHRIVRGSQGMITVAGGKLTTYRRMAAETVAVALSGFPPDAAARHREAPPTDWEPLPGGESAVLDPFIQTGLDLGLPPATVERLVRRYGTETAAVYNLIREDRRLLQPIHPDHMAIGAEVVQVTRRELAVRVEDVLDRRIHLGTETGDGGRAAAPAVAALMGRELGWDTDRIAREAAPPPSGTATAEPPDRVNFPGLSLGSDPEGTGVL